MPLPGLEHLRPSRKQITCNYRDHENSSHRLKWTNEKVRSNQTISVKQLDRNLYKLMKWRSSLFSDSGPTDIDIRKVNNLSANKPPRHLDQTLVLPELSLDCDQHITFLDCESCNFVSPRPFLCSGFMGSLNEVLLSSAVHIGRLQRLRASQQDAFEEREFLDILIRAEEIADIKAAWMIGYITWSWSNRWVFLDKLISIGELDIVLSPMAISWLDEMEYLRLEALVEEAGWTASLHDRAMALPELPLDLDPLLSFLDVKVGGFIAPSSRGIAPGFMKAKQSDKLFADVHIRRLQRLRVAQQEAFEEAEFLHNIKTFDDRLGAEFLNSLRKG